MPVTGDINNEKGEEEEEEEEGEGVEEEKEKEKEDEKKKQKRKRRRRKSNSKNINKNTHPVVHSLFYASHPLLIRPLHSSRISSGCKALDRSPSQHGLVSARPMSQFASSYWLFIACPRL